MNLKNVTALQWLGIIILFNSTLLGGASQLGDLSLSPNMVKAILAVATLGNGFLGGLVTMFGGQGAMARTVSSMDGVEPVRVNAKASASLAAAAVDPANTNIAPTREAASKVEAIAKGTAMVAIILLGSLFAFSDAHAQTKPRLTGDPVADIRAAINPNAPPRMTGNAVNDLLGALDVKLLPDLQYAKALADASGSKVTAPCYQAWIDIINTRQNAGKNADGTAIPMPDPHIVTDFEKMVELRNALQPDSDFMIKCSPVASMVKKDIAGFIGIVISGGAGLATLVPGL